MPLHLAISHNNAAMVELLLSHGARTGVVNPNVSPHNFIAKMYHLPDFGYLHTCTSKGTPLQFAACTLHASPLVDRVPMLSLNGAHHNGANTSVLTLSAQLCDCIEAMVSLTVKATNEHGSKQQLSCCHSLLQMAVHLANSSAHSVTSSWNSNATSLHACCVPLAALQHQFAWVIQKACIVCAESI